MKSNLTVDQKDEKKLQKKKEIREKYTVISKTGVVPKDFRGKLQNFIVNPDNITSKMEEIEQEPAGKKPSALFESEFRVESLTQKLKNIRRYLKKLA